MFAGLGVATAGRDSVGRGLDFNNTLEDRGKFSLLLNFSSGSPVFLPSKKPANF